MKTFIPIFLLAAAGVSAQANEPVFESDGGVTFDDTSKTTELTGHVSYQDNLLSFCDADKVVHNQLTNEIVVTGMSHFNFYGSLQTTQDVPLKGVLRYKIGESVAYFE